MDFLIDRGRGACLTDDSLTGERFRLSMDRIRQMESEELVHPGCIPWFHAAASWTLLLLEHRRMLEDGSFETMPLPELQKRNLELYEEILPENYGGSWADHGHSISVFGDQLGPVMSALYYELRCMIPLVYEGDAERFLFRMELLLEVYFAFVTAWQEHLQEDPRRSLPGTPLEKAVPPASHIREKIRQFLEDYAADETAFRIRRSLAGGSIPEQIIAGWPKESGDNRPDGSGSADLPSEAEAEQGLRSLYRYGAYVSDNETGIFTYLQGLPGEEIARLADTWTEGYRIGFKVTGKDLSIRSRAGILYHIGFERVVRRAVENLSEMGLSAVIPLGHADLFTQHMGRGGGGIMTTSPNHQYAYDHKEDLALFMDDVLMGKRIQALQQTYREQISDTVLYAGPLVLETFGEKPFSPVMNTGSPKFSPSQQKKASRFRQQADLLYDKAVIGKQRSFTIFSFPVPEITRGYEGGDLTASFDEIFRVVTAINTLDYVTYQKVQAAIINVLDTACSVRVLGRGENRTDLTVCLQIPENPETQTIFENCVADVNIPVGEVFTTPRLAGTNGILHVTAVYLEGLFFEDLSLTFRDGRVTDYSCGGFATEQEGREYIEENILFHHETLPMGEFAIGTNTTAAAECARLGMFERLNILIAEKTGPHFAVGDTCYAHEEENHMYNSDGKEIFAKENEYSSLRETDPGKAYFGCHTDITIPYGEVGLLAAVRADGTQIPVIRDGRFVLPGTELLNEPLDLYGM